MSSMLHCLTEEDRLDNENLKRITAERSSYMLEYMPQVFDKFFRSNDPRVRESTGTGLGLSMTQEVIRLHGGELNVQSELNKGSTFTISLPISKRSS